MSNHRLVLVQWHDSYGCSTDWQEISDIDAKPIMCESVGWLVQDRHDCVVIVPHRANTDGFARLDNNEPSFGQGCGDMTIPRSAIEKITEMKAIR